MYNLFLETLKTVGIDLPVWFFWIVLIVIIICAFLWIIKKVIKPLSETINDINAKLDKTDQIDILKENQLRNVENYKQADKEIRKDIKAINDKINVVASMIVEMQERTDETNRAKLKDRIRQSYGYYHSRGKLNKMEKEALEDLIRSYELAGGSNSFVHTTVEPELYQWQIIDNDEEV